MKILKNPIVLAILVGCAVFIIMNYFNKPISNNKDNKKRKGKKRKRKNNDAGNTKETSMIVGSLAALVTWYGARMYFCDPSQDTENLGDNEIESKLNIINANNRDLVSGVVTQKAGGNNYNPMHIKSSSNTARSYQVLGSGLNIPKGELKIPNVMIDFK